MRIAGYIDHPVFKITIFQTNNRYAVKIEHQIFEQTYKFPIGDLVQSPEDIKKIVDEAFLKRASDLMKNMHAIRQSALDRHISTEEGNGFENII